MDGSKVFEFDKFVHAEIQSLAVKQTIDIGKPCYIIRSTEPKYNHKIVEESDLQKDVNDKDSYPAIMDAIADHSGVKIVTASDLQYTLRGKQFNIREFFKPNSTIIFDDNQNLKSFIKELSKLIEKYEFDDFKEMFKVEVKIDEDLSINDRDYLTVMKRELPKIAMNLGIDLEKLLHDKRGTIQGKKFGI